MGDVAASGGYYISCGADKIFAEPVTLTGSIGIFGMIPCVKQLLTDKVGVNFDFVSTNANSVGINLFEPMTPFVRARLQNEINHGYDLFTSRCAKGRHVSQDSIKAIAEGRVWSGGAAKKIGLVDELGSLNDAVKALAKNNKYKKYQVVSYPDADRSIFDILLDLNSQMKVNALKEDMGVYYPVYEHLQMLKDMAPVQARMEQAVVQ
jgi:protease-4